MKPPETSPPSSTVPTRLARPKRFSVLIPILLAAVIIAGGYRVVRSLRTPVHDPLHGNTEETSEALEHHLRALPEQARLPRLIGYLKDDSHGLRYAVVDKLAEIGQAQAEHRTEIAGLLENAFLDCDSETRKRALETLPRVDPDRGLHLLLAGLRDEDPWIQEAAATQIKSLLGEKRRVGGSHIVDRRAVPMLISALNDPNITVSQSAINALSQLVSKSTWRVSQLAPQSKREAMIRQWQNWWTSAKSDWKVPAQFADVPGVIMTRTQPCPDFSLEGIDGKTYSKSSQRGRITLINFWGVACGPCILETPDLVQIDKTYRARGIDVIGAAVGQQGKVDALRKYLQEKNVTYPQALSNMETQAAFGDIEDVPVTILIDAQGLIRGIWQGGPRGTLVYTKAIDRLLAGNVSLSGT